jgi:colicin import membrane protein
MNGILVVVALAGVLASVALFLSHRKARAALGAASSGLERLRADAEEAAKAAQASKADAKERREEAAALRAELKDAKRKAFEQAEAAKRSGGANAIREELDKVTGRLAEARAEAEHQSSRARSLEAELEKARAALERKARAEAAPTPPPAPAAPPPAAAPAAPAPDADRLRAETERADKAEAKLAEVRKRVLELDAEIKKARGRLETEKRVYVVQKGELDLAHDRYAELKRRHDQVRKDYDELVEAVRQAAREEQRQGGKGEPKVLPTGAENPA